jgi:serine/threonine protein kinase
MIAKDGYAKLVDFGLCSTDEKAAKGRRLSSICGTPDYMAPEI